AARQWACRPRDQKGEPMEPRARLGVTKRHADLFKMAGRATVFAASKAGPAGYVRRVAAARRVRVRPTAADGGGDFQRHVPLASGASRTAMPDGRAVAAVSKPGNHALHS